jgi:hypothetical protein
MCKTLILAVLLVFAFGVGMAYGEEELKQEKIEAIWKEITSKNAIQDEVGEEVGRMKDEDVEAYRRGCLNVGRFQAAGAGPSGRIIILDTKLGHVWEVPETPGRPRYLGQVSP